MADTLKHRARRRGTASIYAGSEPRRGELTAHWPEHKKRKRQRFTLSKRAAKRERKDKIIKRAERAAHKARLAAPWVILVRDSEGRA